MTTHNLIEKLSSWMSIVGVTVGIIAITFSIVIKEKENEIFKLSNIEQSKIVEDTIRRQIADVERNINEFIVEKKNSTESIRKLKKQIDQFQEEQQKILLLTSVQRMDSQLQKYFIESVSNRVTNDISSSIESSINGISKRLNNLEKLIVADPTKALSVPLLKRDISDLSIELTMVIGKAKKIDQILLENAVLKSQTQSLKDQLSQLNNWMIGIFGALGVSVIGLVINNIVLHRKPKEKKL